MDPTWHGAGLGAAAGEEKGLWGAQSGCRLPTCRESTVQELGARAGSRPSGPGPAPFLPRGPRESVSPCGRETGGLRKIFPCLEPLLRPCAPLPGENPAARPAPPLSPRLPDALTSPLHSASLLSRQPPPPPLPRPTDLGKARPRRSPSVAWHCAKSAASHSDQTRGSAASAGAGEGAPIPLPQAL